MRILQSSPGDFNMHASVRTSLWSLGPLPARESGFLNRALSLPWRNPLIALLFPIFFLLEIFVFLDIRYNFLFCEITVSLWKPFNFFIHIFDKLFWILLKIKFFFLSPSLCYCYCWVTQSCPTLCNHLDYSMTSLTVPHHLPEFAQVHVHCNSDAIQPSHPLTLSSPSALNSSQSGTLTTLVTIITTITKQRIGQINYGLSLQQNNMQL